MTIDKDTIKDAQKDIKKFDKVYTYYVDRIKNYLRSKVNHDEFTTEDLTSQTFEKAIKNIKTFRWQGVSFSAWLYTIANNTLIDFYRKYKNTAVVSNEFYENIKDPAILTEENFIDKDTRERIRSKLDKLNQREKEVITLKFFDNLSNKEIADRLNLTETNVGTIVYRAINKLKKIIDPK